MKKQLKKKPIDPKDIGVPNICFSCSDPTMKKHAQHTKQRLTRGFDDTELWSLDVTIAEFIYPRLKRFIQINSHSYPELQIKSHDKIKKGSKNDNEEYYVRRWKEILNEILWVFDLLHDFEKKSSWEHEQFFSGKFKRQEYNRHTKKINDALNLFAYFYQNLWD